MNKISLVATLALISLGSLALEQEASSRATVHVNQATGIKDVSCAPTRVDERTVATAFCRMYPQGKGKKYHYDIPKVALIFIGMGPHNQWVGHPEWLNLNGKATIYTPYKVLTGAVSYGQASGRDSFKITMSPADFLHMVSCEKARITCGKVGLILYKANLTEMASVADVMTATPAD